MKLTMGQAAKEAQVSKPTISRWIKKGRITAEKQDDGSYLIDASELNRIKDLQKHADARNGNDNPPMQRMVTPPENSMLQQEVDMLRERLDEKDTTIRELRREKDEERQERQRLLSIVESQTRLLTHSREDKSTPTPELEQALKPDSTPESKPGWFRRLLGT